MKQQCQLIVFLSEQHFELHFFTFKYAFLKFKPVLSLIRIESASNFLKNRAKEFFFKENSNSALLINRIAHYDIVVEKPKVVIVTAKSKYPILRYVLMLL